MTTPINEKTVSPSEEHPLARAMQIIRELPPDVCDELNEQLEAERRWRDGKRAHEFIEFLAGYLDGEETLRNLDRMGHKEFLYRETFDRLLADGVIERCAIQRGKRVYPGLRLVLSDEAEVKMDQYEREAKQADDEYESWKNEVNNKRFGCNETNV